MTARMVNRLLGPLYVTVIMKFSESVIEFSVQQSGFSKYDCIMLKKDTCQSTKWYKVT